MTRAGDNLSTKARPRLRGRADRFRVAGYGVSFIYAVAIGLPLYYLIISAFKTNSEIFTAPLQFPKDLQVTNFIQAQDQGSLLQAIAISLVITAAAELLTLGVAFPAAFAIARIPTRMTVVLEAVFGLGFLIPAFSLLVPIFLLMLTIGLLGNILAVMIFYSAAQLSLSVLLLASYLRQIPREVEEAAVIDGASRRQQMWYVFLPLARPGIVTVVVLNFLEFWNEYLFALVLLPSKSRTVQVAVGSLPSEFITNYGILAAGVLISIVPAYAIFLVSQRQLVEGMFAGVAR